MKLIFSVLLLLASCLCSFAQHPALMYNRQHPVTEDSVGVIKRIAAPPLSKKLKVVYENGRKRKVLKDDVWGFQDRRGRLFRVYEGAVYRTIIKDDIVKYQRQKPGTNEYQWRYSTDLDSPLYWTKRKARRNAGL